MTGEPDDVDAMVEPVVPSRHHRLAGLLAAGPGDLARAGRFLLDRGIYVTLAFYPGVPREEVGFRIQMTTANTDDQVGELLAALDRLADVVPLRPAGS